jgi:hypothetical protein
MIARARADARFHSLHALRISLPCGHFFLDFLERTGRCAQMHTSDRLLQNSHLAFRLPPLRVSDSCGPVTVMPVHGTNPELEGGLDEFIHEGLLAESCSAGP